jgi:NAD-dependent SIR2 family protein deacetylase
LERAEAAAKVPDLVVAPGSTLSVYPAANKPLLVAKRGAPCVILSRGPTEHDDLLEVSQWLEGHMGEILPPAVEAAVKREPRAVCPDGAGITHGS